MEYSLSLILSITVSVHYPSVIELASFLLRAERAVLEVRVVSRSQIFSTLKSLQSAGFWTAKEKELFGNYWALFIALTTNEDSMLQGCLQALHPFIAFPTPCISSLASLCFPDSSPSTPQSSALSWLEGTVLRALSSSAAPSAITNALLLHHSSLPSKQKVKAIYGIVRVCHACLVDLRITSVKLERSERGERQRHRDNENSQCRKPDMPTTSNAKAEKEASFRNGQNSCHSERVEEQGSCPNSSFDGEDAEIHMCKGIARLIADYLPYLSQHSRAGDRAAEMVAISLLVKELCYAVHNVSSKSGIDELDILPLKKRHAMFASLRFMCRRLTAEEQADLAKRKRGHGGEKEKDREREKEREKERGRERAREKERMKEHDEAQEFPGGGDEEENFWTASHTSPRVSSPRIGPLHLSLRMPHSSEPEVPSGVNSVAAGRANDMFLLQLHHSMAAMAALCSTTIVFENDDGEGGELFAFLDKNVEWLVDAARMGHCILRSLVYSHCTDMLFAFLPRCYERGREIGSPLNVHEAAEIVRGLCESLQERNGLLALAAGEEMDSSIGIDSGSDVRVNVVDHMRKSPSWSCNVAEVLHLLLLYANHEDASVRATCLSTLQYLLPFTHTRSHSSNGQIVGAPFGFAVYSLTRAAAQRAALELSRLWAEQHTHLLQHMFTVHYNRFAEEKDRYTGHAPFLHPAN